MTMMAKYAGNSVRGRLVDSHDGRLPALGIFFRQAGQLREAVCCALTGLGSCLSS